MIEIFLSKRCFPQFFPFFCIMYYTYYTLGQKSFNKLFTVMRPTDCKGLGDLKVNFRCTSTCSILKTADPLGMSSLPVTRVYKLKSGISISVKKSLRQKADVIACLLDNKLAVQKWTFSRLKEAMNLQSPSEIDSPSDNFPFKEDKCLDSVKIAYFVVYHNSIHFFLNLVVYHNLIHVSLFLWITVSWQIILLTLFLLIT